MIIDVNSIKKLITVHPKHLKSASDITSILRESEEWSDIYGRSLFEIIQRFDKEIEATEKAEREKENQGLKSKRPCKTRPEREVVAVDPSEPLNELTNFLPAPRTYVMASSELLLKK